MFRITLFLRNNIFCVFFCIFAFFSCASNGDLDEKKELKKVATVGDRVLYDFEVEKAINVNSEKNHVVFRKRFINNWIRKEMLLQKAKMNLSEEEQNVEDRVKAYRESLLINQYKQKYLAEHLDTLVTEGDIELYMTEFSDSFKLKERLYKYYIAKVASKNVKDIATVKNLFGKKQVNLMQDFDLTSTTVISSNEVDWYAAKELLRDLPPSVSEADLEKLKQGEMTTFTSKDKLYTYLLKPVEIIEEGEMSPMEYVAKNVREIILHNRKLALAQQLEYEIYEDAKNKKQFEVY